MIAFHTRDVVVYYLCYFEASLRRCTHETRVFHGMQICYTTCSLPSASGINRSRYISRHYRVYFLLDESVLPQILEEPTFFRILDPLVLCKILRRKELVLDFNG